MRRTPLARKAGRTSGRNTAVGLLLAVAAATTATAAPYLLVSGRWDNTLVVIDLAKALDPANNMTLNAVEAIIPTGNFGPVGLAVTADGNHISLTNVDKAVAGAKDAEAARLIVGTNNPSAASRPFGVAFTPDGKTLLVSNFRANNLSFVDVEKALAGGLRAEVTRLPLATPDGKPSRPRGIAITPDGKYAAIPGAPRGESNSGVLSVMDLAQRKAVGRVTGAGNETYLLALLP